MADSDFRRWICDACGYVYDEAQGDPDSGLAAGTRYDDIPDDWHCPLCGLRKSDLRLLPKIGLHLVPAIETQGCEAKICLKIPSDSNQAYTLQFIAAEILCSLVGFNGSKRYANTLPFGHGREVGTIGLPGQPETRSSKVHIVLFIITGHLELNAIVSGSIKFTFTMNLIKQFFELLFGYLIVFI